MKILLAVDGSTYTKRMLAYLAAHDEWLGAHHQYDVLHVTPSLPPRAAGILDKALVKTYYADETEKVFKPIRSFFVKAGIQARYLAKTGHAGECITKQVNGEDYDMLIMGSRGHGALSGWVMGSVSTQVLSNTEVPVLIVR